MIQHSFRLYQILVNLILESAEAENKFCMIKFI